MNCHRSRGIIGCPERIPMDTSAHTDTHTQCFSFAHVSPPPSLCAFRFWTDVSGFGGMPVPEILEVQTLPCRTDSPSCTCMNTLRQKDIQLSTPALPCFSVGFISCCSWKKCNSTVKRECSRPCQQGSVPDVQPQKAGTDLHVTSHTPDLLLFDLSLPPLTESPTGLIIWLLFSREVTVVRAGIWVALLCNHHGHSVFHSWWDAVQKPPHCHFTPEPNTISVDKHCFL